MKTANLFNDSIGLTIIKKMDYDGIDAVHGALLFAFHPSKLDEDEELDDRFLSLWTLFLVSVGWSEEEYWSEWNSRPHECTCGNCSSEKSKESDSNKSLN